MFLQRSMMTKTITEKDLTYNEIKTIKKIIEKESLDFYSLMIINNKRPPLKPGGLLFYQLFTFRFDYSV